MTDLLQLYSTVKGFLNEKDSCFLRLLIEIDWWLSNHSTRYRLRTIPSHNRPANTHLITRTDQPRFEGSELSVSSSDDLVAALKVLESAH